MPSQLQCDVHGGWYGLCAVWYQDGQRINFRIRAVSCAPGKRWLLACLGRDD